MELHTRKMQVTGLTALGNDRVRVSLGEAPATDGTGPGLGGAPMGGSFSYDTVKEEAPATYAIVNITVTD